MFALNRRARMTLRELGCQDWSKLMDVLKSMLPLSCQAYNWLRVHIAWADKMTDIRLQVLCPEGNCQSGILVALCHRLGMAESMVHMMIFAPDEERSNKLINILKVTTLIPWSSIKFFSQVMEPLATYIKNLLTEMDRNFTADECNVYYMTAECASEKFKNFTIPVKIRIGPLELSHVETVCSNWICFGEDFRDFVTAAVQHNQSVGIFIGDSLIMNAIETWDGCSGIVNTVPGHRNKGFGSLGVKYLLRNLAKHGIPLHVFVGVDNSPSNHMFAKTLGFGDPILK
ncbi:hypothetical protein B566_EDAN002284 [Ephemera danica]|nr:hypothetical protein B566_EDAN002284 [Ephemera danica]